jgi:hypothetical protein
MARPNAGPFLCPGSMLWIILSYNIRNLMRYRDFINPNTTNILKY